MNCPAGSPANIIVDQNGFFINVETSPATSPRPDTVETVQVQPGPLHISNPEDVEPEDDNYDAELSFRKDLESLINHYSREYPSNTPDFILAEYLCGCLELFDKTMQDREKWYGDSVDNQLQNLR